MKHPPKPKAQPQALDIMRPVALDRDFDHILALKPHARRFIFDREASVHLGHFIRDCGDLILRNRQFAVPPFPVTYVQVELDDMLKAIGKSSSADTMGQEGRDTQVGYFIYERRVYPISRNEKRASPALFRYEMDTPAGSGPIFDEPMQSGDPDDEWARAVLLLGTTVDDMPDETTRLDLIRSTRINLMNERFKSSSMKKTGNPDGEFTGITIKMGPAQMRLQVTAAAGDMRTVWAALLLINQKRSFISLRDVPWQAALHKGKRVVYGAHSVVTIHLTGKQTISSLMRPGMHTPKAAHDVKGHFYHYNLHQACDHTWPSMPEISADGIPRWHCLGCGGGRTWKKAYTTGDATIGFVTKDYEVKK